MAQTIYNVKISGIGTLEEILKSLHQIELAISVDVLNDDITIKDYEDETLIMELYEN